MKKLYYQVKIRQFTKFDIKFQLNKIVITIIRDRNITMGNKESKHAVGFADWEKVQTQNGVDIYCNKKNNELAEKRTITIDPHFALNDQLKIYYMRQHNQDSLVRALGAKEVEKKGYSQGICSGHKKVEVLTERMAYRLSDLPQLTFPQSLLFLRQSLRAYSRVFRSYGPIHVTKRLIGINAFGQVKCWVNENWAKNHPEHQFPTLQSTKLQSPQNTQPTYGTHSQAYDARYRDQTQMVHNIVAVIQQKCEQGKFPFAFSDEIYHHSSSFRKLTQYLEDFIAINELFIPPKINYETVFVLKYQNRLAEQHRLSGQMNRNQFNQNGNQLGFQNQGLMNNNEGSRVANYLAGGNQQSLYQGYSPIKNTTWNSGQNLGYSTGLSAEKGNTYLPYNLNQSSRNYQTFNNETQSFGLGTTSPPLYQQGDINKYTTTKPTTTTTHNNPSNEYNTIKTPTLTQPQKSISPISNTGSNAVSISNNLWQKSQSLYKPTQNQSNYSGSYQYSVTNPSSAYVGNYNSGGLISGALVSGSELASKNQMYKPLYSTSGSSFGNATYNYSTTGNYSTFANLQTKIGQGLDNIYKFSSFQQRKLQQHSFNNPNQTRNMPSSYQQFKKNFGKPQTTDGINSYSYTTTTAYNTTNKAEPLFSDSAQKSSIFSFDGKQQFSSKFSGYNGSNTTSNINNNNVRIEGKYAQQFSNLLGPLGGTSWATNNDQNRVGESRTGQSPLTMNTGQQFGGATIKA